MSTVGDPANPADVVSVILKGLQPLTERGRVPTQADVEERANNIAQALLGNFDIRDRPGS